MNDCIGCMLLAVILIRKAWHWTFDHHEQGVLFYRISYKQQGGWETTWQEKYLSVSEKKFIPCRLTYLHSFSQGEKDSRDR